MAQLPPPTPDQVELVRELTRQLTESENRVADLTERVAELERRVEALSQRGTSG